jgi:hypothetical protein
MTFYFAKYPGGQVVSCNGATVVNPLNAPSTATGTQDFTAGEEPALHQDLVVTSLIAVPVNYYGGAVLHSTLYTQGK